MLIDFFFIKKKSNGENFPWGIPTLGNLVGMSSDRHGEFGGDGE